MKKLRLLALTLLALPVMSGCNKQETYKRPLVNDAVYDVEIPTIDSPIVDIKILNVPTVAIEVGYMAYMGIEMEIHYANDDVAAIPFTERLIPIDQLEMLKTPGKKYIDFLFQGNHVSFDLTLKEAGVPVYHKVRFMDHNNSLLAEKTYAYLEPAIYDGKEVEDYIEGDYYYTFANEWDCNTDYVFCDFRTNAIYRAEDLRNYATKCADLIQLKAEDSVTYSYRCFHTIKNVALSSGDAKSLYYMGLVKNVELASSPVIFHKKGSYQVAEGDFSDKDAIDYKDSITKMVRDVYRVGDLEETARYPMNCLSGGHNLELDLSEDESGNSKGIAKDLDEDFGKPNYPVNGRIITPHDDILSDNVVELVKDEMKNASMPIYSDYAEGYYRLSYVANIDLFLEVGYTSQVISGKFMVSKVQVVPAISQAIIKPVLSYSPSGEFNESHSATINFDLNDLRGFFKA